MEKNNTFTQGRILKPLILFALPVLLALFLQAMYGAVDLLIVGKFASSADVSAVSTGDVYGDRTGHDCGACDFCTTGKQHYECAGGSF